MGDDSHPEAEGKAPENSALTWACISTDPSRYAFYADKDVTDFDQGVYCQRLDRIEITAKAAWYITRALRDLRLAAADFVP